MSTETTNDPRTTVPESAGHSRPMAELVVPEKYVIWPCADGYVWECYSCEHLDGTVHPDFGGAVGAGADHSCRR